jgi:hypothetical protein
LPAQDTKKKWLKEGWCVAALSLSPEDGCIAMCECEAGVPTPMSLNSTASSAESFGIERQQAELPPPMRHELWATAALLEKAHFEQINSK